MPILSLENPLSYFIVILLIGVAYALYHIATRNNNEMPTPLQKPMDLQKPVKLQRPERYFYNKSGKIVEIKKVVGKFENGSYLVLDAVGNPVRKKAKYCSC